MEPEAPLDAPIDAPLSEFLAEREAVSGLARHLSRGDSHAAEDLEQEVWTALLARPPQESGSPRGWLRAVTRTRAVERLRRLGRAGRAEREAARPEAVESADEAAARRDGAEPLARALRDLEEPYRSVLVLRFLEDLPPREVARRLKRPVETVRTQTRRGLAQLRAKLEARESRRSSLALVLAFLRRPRAAVPLALGVAGVALLSLSTGALREVVGAPAEVRGVSPAAAAVVEPADAAPERELAASRAPTAPSFERWIELDLRDGADAPLAGAEVALRTPAGERAAGRSDAQGRLALPLGASDLISTHDAWPLSREAAELSVRAPGLAALDLVVFLPERGAAHVAARLAREGRGLVGRVVDGDGRPLAGARVRAAPARGVGARERLDAEGRALSIVRAAATTSDAEGRFAFEGLPCEPLELVADAPGHALAALEVSEDAREAELTLTPAEPLRGTLRLGGLPVAGARVSWSGADGPRWPSDARSTRTDEAGRYELPRPATGTLELTARAEGALATATLELDGGPARWDADLALPGELALRLFEPDGRPASGLYLCLREAEGGALLGTAECDAEGLARFAPTRPGPYDLVVLPRRGSGGWPREVVRDLAGGAGERRLRLAAAEPCEAALEVRFAPDAGARLALVHLAGAVEELAGADAEGRVRWEGLPAGRWRARARFADGSERALGEFTLARGERLDLGRVE